MSDVRIGHINLSTSFNGTGEHFVTLIEALQQHGEQQHVLVRNVTLAKRLDAVDNVTVGPVARSAVTACCLMPHCDLVHIHDPNGAQAGLLLTLTRSIPYVLTHRDNTLGRNPLTRAIYRRAARVICLDASDAAILRHYDPGLHITVVPDIERPGSADDHLHVYQNSQSTPIAGSNGIQ